MQHAIPAALIGPGTTAGTSPTCQEAGRRKRERPGIGASPGYRCTGSTYARPGGRQTPKPTRIATTAHDLSRSTAGTTHKTTPAVRTGGCNCPTTANLPAVARAGRTMQPTAVKSALRAFPLPAL